jgi:hypothetical protein
MAIIMTTIGNFVLRQSGESGRGVKIYEPEEIGISETTSFIFSYSTVYFISFILSLLYAAVGLFHNSFRSYWRERKREILKSEKEVEI